MHANGLFYGVLLEQHFVGHGVGVANDVQHTLLQGAGLYAAMRRVKHQCGAIDHSVFRIGDTAWKILEAGGAPWVPVVGHLADAAQRQLWLLLINIVCARPADQDDQQAAGDHRALGHAPHEGGMTHGGFDPAVGGHRQCECQRHRDGSLQGRFQPDGPAEQDENRPVPEVQRVGDLTHSHKRAAS